MPTHTAYKLIHGDSRHLPLPDQSVHCIVTSPPYWSLRDYGTAFWTGGDPACKHVVRGSKPALPTCIRCGAVRQDQQIGLETVPDCLAWARHELPCNNCYVCSLRSVFTELWRVLRADGTVWLNLGDSYAQGGGSTAAPTNFHHQRKRRLLSTAARTIARWHALPGLKKKDLVGVPWRVALALQADGWYLRTDIVWAKGNPMPENVKDRPTRSHEFVFLLTKSRHYYYDSLAIAEPIAAASKRRYSQRTIGGQQGGFKQEMYQAGITGQKARNRPPSEIVKALALKGKQTRNARTVWPINTTPSKLPHFAMFPQELPRRCILAGTGEKGCCLHCGAPWQRVPLKALMGRDKRQDKANKNNTVEGHSELSRVYMSSPTRSSPRRSSRHKTVDLPGTLQWMPGCLCQDNTPIPSTVLDPFMGSGTTGLVALQYGRSFTGVDLNPAYLKLAQQRIKRDI